MIFHTKKELDAFKKKHQTKLLKLEKKINFDEVKEYNLLKEEKKILDSCLQIGDYISWWESDGDGYETWRQDYEGEVISVSFSLYGGKYDVKTNKGEVRRVEGGFNSHTYDVRLKKPEVKISIPKSRSFGGE